MPVRYPYRIVLLIAALSGFSASFVQAGGVVRSALDRPDRPDPTLIAVGPTLGASFSHEHALSWGFAGSILFRPAAASEFLGPLYDWNTGLILEGEWRRLAPKRDLLTADVVLRRYAVDMRDGVIGTSLFVGAGGGLALIGYPVTTAAADATSSPRVTRGENLLGSLLFEVGYEHRPATNLVLISKVQWRNAIEKPFDYSHWSIHALVGIPVPW